MKNEIIFRTTLDRQTALISFGMIGILLTFPLVLGLISDKTLTVWLYGSLITIAVVITVFLICRGFLPRKLIVTPDQVMIDRPYGKKSIARNRIRSVRRMTRDDLKKLLRIAGGDGVFGCFGRYRSAVHPELFVYARRSRKDWILIETTTRKYVVAPVEGDEFIALLNTK